MKKVFLDMDDVIVDFDGFKYEYGLSPTQIKEMPGAYRSMKALPGAIQAVRDIIALGFDVFIATKPPTGVAHAYSEKAQWIFDNIPELSAKIIITNDKGLLGDREDFLFDDRPHKGNCGNFKGTLIPFVGGYTWQDALRFLQCIDPNNSSKPKDLYPARIKDIAVRIGRAPKAQFVSYSELHELREFLLTLDYEKSAGCGE